VAQLDSEAHLDHWDGLDSQDLQAHQVTRDSPVRVGINQDREDHVEGLADKVFEVVLVQLVPADRQVHRAHVGTLDQMGRLDRVDLKVGMVTEDLRDFVAQLDDLDNLVHKDSQDIRVKSCL